MPDGKELTIETLLNFIHFRGRTLHNQHDQSSNQKSNQDDLPDGDDKYDGDSDYDEILHGKS